MNYQNPKPIKSSRKKKIFIPIFCGALCELIIVIGFFVLLFSSCEDKFTPIYHSKSQVIEHVNKVHGEEYKLIEEKKIPDGDVGYAKEQWEYVFSNDKGETFSFFARSMHSFGPTGEYVTILYDKKEHCCGYRKSQIKNKFDEIKTICEKAGFTVEWEESDYSSNLNLNVDSFDQIPKIPAVIDEIDNLLSLNVVAEDGNKPEINSCFSYYSSTKNGTIEICLLEDYAFPDGRKRYRSLVSESFSNKGKCEYGQDLLDSIQFELNSEIDWGYYDNWVFKNRNTPEFLAYISEEFPEFVYVDFFEGCAYPYTMTDGNNKLKFTKDNEGNYETTFYPKNFFVPVSEESLDDEEYLIKHSCIKDIVEQMGGTYAATESSVEWTIGEHTFTANCEVKISESRSDTNVYRKNQIFRKDGEEIVLESHATISLEEFEQLFNVNIMIDQENYSATVTRKP